MSSVTEASKAPTSNEDDAAKCPVDHSTRSTWQNLASLPPDHPLPPSTRPLSTKREISSIPRGPSGLKDSTGAKGDGKWVYPSESQFYAALLRKHQAAPSTVDPSKSSHGEETSSTAATLGARDHGVIEVDASGAAVTNGNVVKPPRADDMRIVVPIHNAVNEQTWAKVLQWEAEQGGQSCGGVRLVSFKGDSKKLTPKARWRILLGYQRPFDRHDWVVDRCGTRVHYVIDYYTGKIGPNGGRGNPLSFYIDARPALDNWEGIRMRFTRFWRGILSRGNGRPKRA